MSATVDLSGVCKRWAVIRKCNQEPVEGTLYTERMKAAKRKSNTHCPNEFAVAELAVLPMATMMALVERIEELEKALIA